MRLETIYAKIDNKQYQTMDEFEQDAIEYIIDNYKIPDVYVAKKIYDRGYGDGHSFGFTEIMYYIIDYAEFAEEILN